MDGWIDGVVRWWMRLGRVFTRFIVIITWERWKWKAKYYSSKSRWLLWVPKVLSICLNFLRNAPSHLRCLRSLIPKIYYLGYNGVGPVFEFQSNQTSQFVIDNRLLDHVGQATIISWMIGGVLGVVVSATSAT